MSKYGNKFERGLKDSFRQITPGNKKKFPDYPRSNPRVTCKPQKPLRRGASTLNYMVHYNLDIFSCLILEEKVSTYEIKLKEILPAILKEMGLERAPKIKILPNLGDSGGTFQYSINNVTEPTISLSLDTIENPTEFIMNVMGVKKEYVFHGILIHELQHWKQWLEGRIALTSSGRMWEGKPYIDRYYGYEHEHPCEVEANNTVKRVMAALYTEPVKLVEYNEPVNFWKPRYWFDIPALKNPTKIILSGI
jgi:hypothetical protein